MTGVNGPPDFHIADAIGQQGRPLVNGSSVTGDPKQTCAELAKISVLGTQANTYIRERYGHRPLRSR
jgi:hypothetical protein